MTASKNMSTTPAFITLDEEQESVLSRFRAWIALALLYWQGSVG